MSTKDVPKKLLPYLAHGFTIIGESGADQVYGNCHECGDEKHLYISKTTGQYHCKKGECGTKGNVFTFLTSIITKHREETSEKRYKSIAIDRGIPRAALKRFGVCFNGDRWLIPCYGTNGYVRDIRLWRLGTNHTIATSGCKPQIIGLNHIKESTSDTIWLCEGQWDAIALKHLLYKRGIKDIVLGMPGADIYIPKEHLDLFHNKHMVLCYDADDAGDRGSHKIAEQLKNTAKSIRFVSWPESKPKGYDIRDFIKQYSKNRSADSVYNKLCEWITDEHRRKDFRDNGADTYTVAKKRPTFKKIINLMSSWLEMDKEMIEALRVCFAVAFSQQLGTKDPVWLYLISPPGGGKTQTVCTMKESDRVIFRSTLTPHGLVSGFRAERDPSLLSQVDNKILVLKDATEIISLPLIHQDEIFSILRGAYDGHVSKTFGNNVKREYFLHFTIIMAVTPAINAFPRATLGDRFLKFHMKRGKAKTVDSRVAAAIESVSLDEDKEAQAQEMVTNFLAVNISSFPEIPLWAKQRLVPLCSLVALLRATVDKDKFRQDVLYRPEEEYGTRLAKQLAKLLRCLPIVDGKHEITVKHYKTIERIALDTAIDFHVDILRAIQKLSNDANAREISKLSKIPMTTLRRRLSDLEMLRIIVRKRIDPNTPGRPKELYKLTKRSRQLWSSAKIT